MGGRIWKWDTYDIRKYEPWSIRNVLDIGAGALEHTELFINNGFSSDRDKRVSPLTANPIFSISIMNAMNKNLFFVLFVTLVVRSSPTAGPQRASSPVSRSCRLPSPPGRTQVSNPSPAAQHCHPETEARSRRSSAESRG